jgi:hypothetical protein
MKKSIKPRDLGKGEALVIAPKEQHAITFGLIMGRASSVRETTMADATGEVKTYRALAGVFNGYVYKDGETVSTAVRREANFSAGLLYLPEGIAEMFIDAVETADGDVVEFGVELGCNRASNPRGYEWFGIPVFEPAQADDPMSLLLARVSTLALTDETGEEVTIAAPKAKATAAKKG